MKILRLNELKYSDFLLDKMMKEPLTQDEKDWLKKLASHNVRDFHIEEIDKGGKDELGNLQIICSACHKLKNWARLYTNWHLNKEGKKDGNTKTTIN